MSSSSNYHSSQLHRVNRHSNGKRPFEECGGYDSDPDSSMNNSLQASGSTSGNTHHFPTNSSSDTSSGEGRNKRARSTSSSDTDVSSSSDSVSTGYNTAQSSSRSDLGFGGPSVLPANEVDCPVPPVASPPFVAIQDVEMSDLHLGIRPSPPRRNRIPTPAMAEDNLRSSLERFAEFDRQIAALRSSLAATRSPLPPPLGSSGGEDPFVPRDDWAAMSSGFLSGGSTELPASGPNVAGSSNVPVAPSETISSMSTFSSSDGSASVTVGPSTSSGTPSVSFSLAYSSIPRYPPYPSYRPSPGGSSSAAAQERSENPISSDSTLPSFMRPASPDVSAPTRFVARPSLSSISSGSTSSSSLLGLNPEPSLPSSPSPPIISDDLSTRYGIVVDELGSVSRGLSARREDGLSRDSLIHSVSPGGEGSSFILGDRRAEQFGSPSQARPDARLRVLRDPLEREAVRSVFDVFGIGESTQERNRQGRSPVRESAASHNHIQPPPGYSSMAGPSPQRTPESLSESPRGYATNTTPATTTHARPPEFHSRLYSSSSWSSIPSSNSLMSESASERRHAFALERFHARRPRPSSEADEESDGRWQTNLRGEGQRGDVSVPRNPDLESVVPEPESARPPPARAGTDPVFTYALEPFSELFEETERIAGEWAARDRTRDEVPQRRWDRARELERERERELGRVWAWEREREREREVQNGSLAPNFSLGSESAAREESPRRPSSGQPPLGSSSSNTTTGTTTRGGQYSYSNLNLSSFQSGLFRDSLRRNAEVNQASSGDGNASPGPGLGSRTRAQVIIPPVVSGRVAEPRASSQLDVDDSGSEMDFDELADDSRAYSRERQANQVTAQDQPRRQLPLNLRPGFSILRRGSVVVDSDGVQYPNRGATTPSRPAPDQTRSQAHPFDVAPLHNGNNGRQADRERDRDRFVPGRLLESMYRPQDDTRRNSLMDWNQHPHNLPHHTNTHAQPSGLSMLFRGERTDANGNRSGDRNGGSDAESRRTSLGFGGSIRSRWARLANPQSSNATGASGNDTSSSSRQRSPPHPLGARPQAADHRRVSSASITNTPEPAPRPHPNRAFGHPPQWVINAAAAGGSTTTTPHREAPWRSLSGPRNSYTQPSIPVTATARGPDAASDLANRTEEQRSRIRSLRQRLQLDRNADGIRGFRPGMLRSVMARRGNMGDYMPDEMFDDSYEALLSLSNALGEVRSRATPEDVIATLPSGTFEEWQKEDSETRCPICLDDYEPSDAVTKLLECPHWLHKTCLEQWLRTANTCPVCRKKVKSAPSNPARRHCPQHRGQASPGTNSETSGSSSAAGQSRPLQSSARPHSFITVDLDRISNQNSPWAAEARAVASNQSSQAPRFVLGRRDASTRDDFHEPPLHPMHIYHTRPHSHVHAHLPHHVHYHRPSHQPSPSRPAFEPSGTNSHSQHHLGPMPLLGRRGSDSSTAIDEPMSDARPTMVSARRSALEQLIVPHTPASDSETRNEPRNSTGMPYIFDMPVPRQSARRPDPSGPPSVASSFTIAPSSSVAFTSAPAPTAAPLSTGLPPATRPEAPTVIITNSTEAPVMVTSRTSHTFNSLFNLEPANATLDSSQRHPSMGSSAQVPSELEANPWEDIAFGRAARRARYYGYRGPGPSGPSDGADPTAGSSGGTGHPWWST